jgi:gas vesicle protein
MMLIHWQTFLISFSTLWVSLLLKWSRYAQKRKSSKIIQRLSDHHEQQQEELKRVKEASQQAVTLNQEIQEMLQTMKSSQTQDISDLLKTQKFNVS